MTDHGQAARIFTIFSPVKLPLPFIVVSRLLLAVAVLSWGTGCVPTSDYEALQKENQELQKSVDQLSAQLRQMQTQLLQSQQLQVQMVELQARLEEARRLVEEKEAEMRLLEERWEKFKGERRKAMVGKQFQELALGDGRVLKNVEVTGLVDDQIAIRHEGGFLKVAMADGGEELRWQACFDPQDAVESLRRARLEKARSIGAHLETSRKKPTGSASTTSTVSSTKEEAEMVRKVITAQRNALNNAYNRLLASNRSALRGSSWNSGRPEDSGLINVFAERRAVLGLGELDSLAAAIKSNLRKLHDLESN